MDIFEQYLQDNKSKENCRALICKSYREVFKKQNSRDLDNTEINDELATYGDALLKFALCSILLDNCTQLSVEKAKYECDKALIEIIAKHYSLLEYIKFNRDDANIVQEYKYYEKNNTKYIATAVEAVIGAIYKENNDFKSICNLVNSWIALIKKPTC